MLPLAAALRMPPSPQAKTPQMEVTLAVPRLLRVAAPGKSMLAVGFLEREANGAEPAAAERAVYDIVVITPRAARPDPCANLR